MKIKMKNNMSISKKLFLITTLIFIVFISGTLITQSIFFEKFYISKKKSDLQVNIKNFVESYNKENDSNKISDLIDEYDQNYNINILIIDKNNIIKYVTKPSRDKFTNGKFRELTGYVMSWTSSPEIVDNFKQNNKSVIDLEQERKNVPGSVIEISPTNKNGDIVFALSSLQPVNEAVSVIEQLYHYFYVVGILFILILALVYSNMIVKPLLKINKVASKMAKLNFQEKCDVNSEDEIGNVASSLNFLSENLSKALTSLREANAKLEKDIEKERNLEKMRKEFVASVSHELKTPIALIDGYTVGLKDNIFEDEDKEYYLDIILDEARKMGNLVSDMLDLSHLESGIFKFTREEFDISELILFTLRKYEAIIYERQVNTKLNLLKGITAYADWNRMEQVFTNFITNALRHVNEHGEIYISMIDKGNDISIEIENTGSKIPEEEITKVWDKFYKIDKSRNRKFGGTGIGLSIVKNILMLHNYSYGVENTEGGVKFYIIIPKDYSK